MSHLTQEAVADLRHELRTPLSAVIGLTGLLLDSSLTSDQRKLISAVRSAGEHLAGVVDVCPVRSVTHGAQNTFAIETLASSVVTLFSHEAARRGLALRLVTVAGTARRILGNATPVRQVLINLVSNAVKFTSEGEVVVRLSPSRCGVNVEVSDSGPGFDPTDIGPRTDGTGRGLRISQQLLMNLGSELIITGLHGVGTIVRFDLPAAD